MRTTTRNERTAKKQQLSLDASLRHILEECRWVLPSIQALFGFQSIAVFNEDYTQKLSLTEQ
jgi:nicotinamide mononucleotide adenylyltransferase